MFLSQQSKTYKNRDSLYSVTKKDGSVNLSQLKENINSWCTDGVDLNHIIRQLTVEQIKELLPRIPISVVLEKEGAYYWAFQGLSIEKASVLAKFLVNDAGLLPRPRQLGEILNKQPTDVAKAILENYKTKLPFILDSLDHIAEAASLIEECTFFYREVLSVLDLSSILITFEHIKTLLFLGGPPHYEIIAMQIAKQASTIFQMHYISMHNFRDIIVRVSSDNTEYYNLMYLAMLQVLPRVLNHEIIEQNKAEIIEYEICYFVQCLKNASQEVQKKVWSALKECLPKNITESKEKRNLIRIFQTDVNTDPDLYRHFLSIFPESFEKDDLIHFAEADIPMVSLIIELSAYKKERNRNPNNYYYFGIFKYFGAHSKQEEFSAIDALIEAISDPDNSSLDSKHITALSQGGPSQVMKLWSRTYGFDYKLFLKHFEKNEFIYTR